MPELTTSEFYTADPFALSPSSRKKNLVVELIIFAVMADVRYFLRDVKSTRKTVILLSFGYKGKRMRVSTGISTAVSEWDPARQRFIEHEQRPDLRELNLRIIKCLGTAQVNLRILERSERQSSNL